MLFTDLIAIMLVLVVATGLLIHSARTIARLDRENNYLRGQLRDMRKRLANSTERPF